jgi:hypothetical protein
MKQTRHEDHRSHVDTGNDAGGCAAFRKPEIAALAHLYWSPPGSDIVREDLIERARLALSKYDLEPSQIDELAPHLASAMHMLIEQNGGKSLPEDYEREIEYHVLKWHGITVARQLVNAAMSQSSGPIAAPTSCSYVTSPPHHGNGVGGRRSRKRPLGNT